MEFFLFSLLFFLGASSGSFFCCLNDRVARLSGFDGEFPEATLQETLQYLLFRRSYCFKCDSPIPWYYNIPVISYLLLRGRCSTCTVAISERVFIFEILFGCVAVTLWFFNDALTTLYWFTLFALMLSLADFDRRHMHIPNLYTTAILWLGLLASIHGISSISVEDAIYGAMAAFVVLFLLRLIFLYYKGVEVLGTGDSPLAAALAIWLGFNQVPYFLLAASLIGIAWVCIQSRVTGRSVRGLAIPFGPSLVMSCSLLLLFSDRYEIYSLS